MLQIRNNLEIVEILRRNPSHIREIAARLKLVPSTAMRTLRVLQEENVADFQKEGRNSRYFLKDTPEAELYIHLSECYKLLKMQADPLMRRVSKELREMTNGELIVLFGSYTKGSQTSASDIDIYVETADNTLKQKLSEISKKLSVKIGKFNKDTPLGKEMIKHHIIIQDVERFYQLLR